MSKIPKYSKKYLKCLELCITAMELIVKSETGRRPMVAKVISSALDFLRDYRDDIIERKNRRKEG